MTRPLSLRDDVATLLSAFAALDRPALEGLQPEVLQKVIQETLVANADPPRQGLDRIVDSSIARPDGTELAVRLYCPRADAGSSTPVVMFFHGGGFMTGNLDTHHALAAEIAHLLGWPVVAVDYRLAPQHPFPAAVDDCVLALRWLDAEPALLGREQEMAGIVLAGDSAGGGLAAVCARECSDLAHRVLCQWLMYATTDLSASGGSMVEYGTGFLLTAQMMGSFIAAYLGGRDSVGDHRVSPLAAADFSDLPPAMVFTCEFDPLRDQGRQYAACLAAAGVSVRYREGRGLVHGAFTQLRSVPSAHADLQQCAADVISLVLESATYRGGP